MGSDLPICACGCGKPFEPRCKTQLYATEQCRYAVNNAKGSARAKEKYEKLKETQRNHSGSFGQGLRDPWGGGDPLYRDGYDAIYPHDARCGTDPLPPESLPQWFAQVAA